MAATRGGRVRRRNHARSIIAAASRHARSRTIKPTTSRWLMGRGWWGSGARRSPRSLLGSRHGYRLRPQAGLGADVDLMELLLGKPVCFHQLADVGADDRQQEPDRD